MLVPRFVGISFEDYIYIIFIYDNYLCIHKNPYCTKQILSNLDTKTKLLMYTVFFDSF